MSTFVEPDLAEVSGRFGYLLHAAGIPVTPGSAGRFADAVALARPTRTDELYWLARVTLVPDRVHLETFEAVFDQVFRGLLDSSEATRNPHGPLASVTPSEGRPPSGRRPPQDAAGDHDPQPGIAGSGDAPPDESNGRDVGDRSDGILAAASDDERLRTRAFGACTPEELAQLRLMIGALRIDPPQRRSRRTRMHRLGNDPDLRATLRAARRTGGDPVRQVRRRRRSRPRRVVLIADVSGSMESYGRAYLYLLHGAVRSIGAEAFVFATRLHRLTRPLRLQHPANALTRAMASAPDWSGGTRIGEALRAFNDGYARRGVGRGAIVVIVSDGWESSDPSVLGREMERLSRLAHRIVWVNPRKQREDYRPLVGGMAAALPYVDVFLSGHSIDSLVEVIGEIGSTAPATRRRASRPSTGDDRIIDSPTTPKHRVMNPDYGTVTALSPHRQWDFTTRPIT